MSVAADTLSDEVEPYLLRRELIMRSPRGRRATPGAYRHLGLPEPEPEPDPLFLLTDQRRLFE
jgi:Holliday junction DNA helicase RuvB